MAYLSSKQLEEMGFKFIGDRVKVSDKAVLYDCEHIEIGDNSRIDDFCVISGAVKIGRNVHVTPQCLIAGGAPGVVIEDFVALAYGAKIFSQSDDYSGETMTNSTVPSLYKKELKQKVHIGKHTIIGASVVVLPGVSIGEGCAIGANSLVLRSIEGWGVYAGSPVKKIRDRKKDLLELEKLYLSE